MGFSDIDIISPLLRWLTVLMVPAASLVVFLLFPREEFTRQNLRKTALRVFLAWYFLSSPCLVGLYAY